MKERKLSLLILLSTLITACGRNSTPEQIVNDTQPQQQVESVEISIPESASVPMSAPMQQSSSPSAPSMRQNANAPMQVPILRDIPIQAKEIIIVAPEECEKYGKLEQNPVKSVAQEAVSTFSIDVDTGSYANVRRFLNRGRLPPTDAVRLEELINYFDYAYAAPHDDKPFAVHTEVVDSPWKSEAKLIKIGIKAKEMQISALPPANLVFLVDVSGSMDEPNKLPLVQKTLRILTERLREQDRVSIITYAGNERLVLPSTSGANKDAIMQAIDNLKASGSTAGEKGIRLAYAEAEKSFIKEGINRILLATDGDFNVGITDFDTLKDLIAEKRKTGISLTTLGYGEGNYNEHLMEQAADAGDGNYSYIDSEQEAKKVLHRQLSSTLTTVAQDVKIQVEFNPATVKEYRLIGYENRILKQEDFNNDKVDAGDIGAGHNVTALYEIIPAGKQGWLENSRYQTPSSAANDLNEYAYVKLRYKMPYQTESRLISQAIPVSSKALAQADNDTRWAIAVSAYGQQLQGGDYNGTMDWQSIYALAQSAAQPDPFGERAQLLELIKQAQNLSSAQK